MLGDAVTHDRLVRELATGVGAAVAFVEYDRSPEARFPVAVEQAYATARWITGNGARYGLDSTRMAVAGDSAGGNITAALALMAKQRGDVTFVHQSMYYPVTDAGQDTASYREFAGGPHLTAEAMAWFWDCYAPGPAQRAEITVSPLRAGLGELRGLPGPRRRRRERRPARRGRGLRAQAAAGGVPTTSIRYNATLHDFMMLNLLRGTHAATAAVEQAVRALRTALRTG